MTATTQTTKITKGTRVYMLTDWDRSGTVAVQEFTVRSWGQKEGHLITTDGSNALFRFYMSDTDTVVVAVADTPDVEALALARGAVLVSRARSINESRLLNPMFVRAAVEARLAALHEPRVIWR